MHITIEQLKAYAEEAGHYIDTEVMDFIEWVEERVHLTAEMDAVETVSVPEPVKTA